MVKWWTILLLCLCSETIDGIVFNDSQIIDQVLGLRWSNDTQQAPSLDVKVPPQTASSTKIDFSSRNSTMANNASDAIIAKSNTSITKFNASITKFNTSVPLVNISSPLVNISASSVNTSLPLVNTSSPLVNTSSPLVNNSLPLVNTSVPLVNISTFGLNNSTAGLNNTGSTAGLNNTGSTSGLNRSSPVLNATATIIKNGTGAINNSAIQSVNTERNDTKLDAGDIVNGTDRNETSKNRTINGTGASIVVDDEKYETISKVFNRTEIRNVSVGDVNELTGMPEESETTSVDATENEVAKNEEGVNDESEMGGDEGVKKESDAVEISVPGIAADVDSVAENTNVGEDSKPIVDSTILENVEVQHLRGDQEYQQPLQKKRKLGSFPIIMFFGFVVVIGAVWRFRKASFQLKGRRSSNSRHVEYQPVHPARNSTKDESWDEWGADDADQDGSFVNNSDSALSRRQVSTNDSDKNARRDIFSEYGLDSENISGPQTDRSSSRGSARNLNPFAMETEDHLGFSDDDQDAWGNDLDDL